MQEDLIRPSDAVDAIDVEVAVTALREVASGAGEPKDRIHAAEVLLRYGVSDPYYSAAGPEPEPNEEA